MHAVNYSSLRQNLAATLDYVNESHLPTLVTRQNGKSAVLMDYDDYLGLEETLRLLSTPANAQHLLRSISEIEAGQVIKRDLLS